MQFITSLRNPEKERATPFMMQPTAKKNIVYRHFGACSLENICHINSCEYFYLLLQRTNLIVVSGIDVLLNKMYPVCHRPHNHNKTKLGNAFSTQRQHVTSIENWAHKSDLIYLHKQANNWLKEQSKTKRDVVTKVDWVCTVLLGW